MRNKVAIILAAVMVMTCGGDAAQMMADAMSSGDAYAGGTEIALTCEAFTRTTTYDDGRIYTTTEWIARTDIGVDPRDQPRVRVLLCDKADFTSAAPSCPTDATCTGPDFPQATCFTTTASYDVQNRLFVFCGLQTTEQLPGEPATVTGGFRYNTVKAVLE